MAKGDVKITPTPMMRGPWSGWAGLLIIGGASIWGCRLRAREQSGTRAPGTKPYKFIGFGAMDGPKPYKFIEFGAMDVTKPYKFIGFGAMYDAAHPTPGYPC